MTPPELLDARPELMDAQQTLGLLGWPPERIDSLYRGTRLDQIPHITIGRRRYWSRARILAWMAGADADRA